MNETALSSTHSRNGICALYLDLKLNSHGTVKANMDMSIDAIIHQAYLRARADQHKILVREFQAIVKENNVNITELVRDNFMKSSDLYSLESILMSIDGHDKLVSEIKKEIERRIWRMEQE